MGEITELILKGILCQNCGSFIDDFEVRCYPRTCDDCNEDDKNDTDTI